MCGNERQACNDPGGQIAAGLPHVRLVCKAACQGVNDSCESLDLWDLKHLYGEANPTQTEITSLFRKLPVLRRLDLYWFDRSDFMTVAMCVVKLAEERGKDAVISDAYVHYEKGTIHFQISTLQRLMYVIRTTGGRFFFLERDVELRDSPQLTRDLGGRWCT